MHIHSNQIKSAHFQSPCWIRPISAHIRKKNHESEWELAFAPLFLLYPSLSLLASVAVLMEESGRAVIGSRQSDLNKSFKLAIRSLLTTCSKEVTSRSLTCEQFLPKISFFSFFAQFVHLFPFQPFFFLKEFGKAFDRFSSSEQNSLHRLFFQVCSL